jgi:hypothetical protein
LKSLNTRPKFQFSEPRLHWPNRLGWSTPMKPPTPMPPPPIDAPKFTLPVRFSLTRKTRSMSPLSFACRVSGNGSGVSKKPRFPTFCQLRSRRSWLNTSPGTIISWRRMHSSDV